ncbi:MAG: hypothetical protein LLG06_02260 [Desulfobacteraceae bacterium]|nr:hypothetical protein [Desulfobacteraceae bacterium]
MSFKLKAASHRPLELPSDPAGLISAKGSNILTDAAYLILLTLLALLVHGYHLGLEDEAVYLPAIKYNIDPTLYPHDSVFFLVQMKFTLYDKLMALLIRASHVRLELFVFVAHIVSLFLVLAGCLRLSRKIFEAPEAQWASVTFIAALMTLPVAGTALLLVDQHLHPRAFATAFILFAVAGSLERKFLRSALWILAAGAISPLMALPGAVFAAYLAVPPQKRKPLALLFPAAVASPAVADAPIWEEVTRAYFYITRWSWYELLGVIGPIVIFYVLSLFGSTAVSRNFSLICRRISIFGLVAAVFSLILCTPAFERFLALQPMRSFHLVYLLLCIYAGGLIGLKVLRNRSLRWILFFLPFCFAMFYVQRCQFPASDHIEMPGIQPRNEYAQAFEWIRRNTPKSDLFALDPRFMESEGAEFHGFRALAERSMLADLVKDAVVVSVLVTANRLTDENVVNVSAAAGQWREEVEATRNWKNFTLEDFRGLKDRFGVKWVVLEKPGIGGLDCPYENKTVKVCRIE